MNDEEKLDRQFIKMTTTKVEPLVLKLATPAMVSMLISSIYNMADTYFVGKINTSATASVGVAFSLMAMIQAVGFFFGHGSGNYISRALGRKDYEHADIMASVGVISSFIFGLFITVLGLVFLKPLAVFLGATDTILPYACDYMKYILMGVPFMTAAITVNNQLRFQGNAFYSMIGITSGGVLNMVLDPLFIFTFKMGVGGAAIATSISQIVSFVLLFVGTYRKGIPIKFKNFKPSAHYIKEIFLGGLPSLARQGCGSVATLCLNNVAGFYGDAAIAALSIVSKIMMFTASAMIGYGQGFQPVCGINYGAKLYSRVKKSFWFCVKSSFAALLLFALIGFVFAPHIVAVFRDDPAVIEIGTAALKWQCISFPLTGFIVLCNMMAQTIGKAARATVLAMSRQFIFFIPALFIMRHFFALSGIEAAQAISDVCSFIISVPIGLSVLKQMKE